MILMMSLLCTGLVSCLPFGNGTETDGASATSDTPETNAPTTEAPTTEAPTAEKPTAEAPTAEEPTTEAPTTETPTTGGNTPDPTPSKVTIACVGDSITAGVGVDENERAQYSYPGRLASALGEGYEVLNYGQSGATMCSTSALIYPSKNWFVYSGKHEEMKARAKDIDIAFIMLGTNDGNSSNANISDLMTNRVNEFKADYESNLTQMVNDLRQGNANVRIYLMTSPKCFRTGNTWEQTLTDVVRPLQYALADKLDLEIYDMYTFSANTMTQSCFPDNLHPGKRGYNLMGRELAGLVADLYGTELMPDDLINAFLLNYEETFDTVANGTTINATTDQADQLVTLGNSKLRVRVRENSTLTVNNGVLALTRSATNTDAFVDVIPTETMTAGKYTFEISLKASENFNSRGAIFVIFGYQFLKYTTAGDITNNAGTKIGSLTSDRFQTITLNVDGVNGTYEILIDGVKVDNGSFTFVDAIFFRPIQFFANGNSTLYLDYIKASQKP